MANGEIGLSSSTIQGSLDFHGSKVLNVDKNALRVNNSMVRSNVFFTGGFYCEGEINLKNTSVGGNLEFEGVTVIGTKRASLHADAMDCAGSIFIRGRSIFNGRIRLLGVRVKRNLQFYECTLNAPGDVAFDGQGMRVDGTFTWRDMIKKPVGKVQLNPAMVGIIVDDEQSWPEDGNLDLDGFTYNGFSGKSPTTAAERLNWIRLQPSNEFRPQPYEQLTRVLRSMGHDRDAVTIAINKQRDSRKRGKLPVIAKLWNWFLSVTMDYGYVPSKVILRFIVPLIILGWLFFGAANQLGVMFPSKERVYMAEEAGNPRPAAYPKFDALIYSIDVFIPLFDLHQEDYWLPNASVCYGTYFRTYLWFHIMLGWIFSTLAVVALTGVIRRD